MRHVQNLVAAAALVAAPAVALGQQAGAQDGGEAYPVDPLSIPRPVAQAVRVEAPPTIDGRLDDEAWRAARPTSETWIQVTPEPGWPASEHTEVSFVYDATTLYVGAVLHDSDPATLVVPGLNQDFDTQSSDMFGVAVDTYLDHQNGFVFAANPGGAIWDAQTFNDQRDVIPAWEGIFDVRTSVTDSAWVVEMAIPFATLRFNPVVGEQVWGLNLFRRIRRRNEDVMWAPLPLQYRAYKFSMAGTLRGLRDLPRARNLWVKPYAAADRISGSLRGAADGDAEAGLDVKWGVTPRMTLDLTLNTDFSQVEVDAEQVNLTRFSLFFPEKRDFFLENEGTFAFQDVSIRNFKTGSSGRAFRLFHSRRIGLSDAREPLPILGGARLTGRIGDRLEVGFLDMQTRSLPGVGDGPATPAENFSVARVKGLLSGGSYVGAILVNRQATGVDAPAAPFNRAYGVDANVNLLRNLVLSGYLSRTDENAPAGGDRNAAMLQAAWRSDVLNTSALFKQVGDGFNPGVGFVARRAVRRWFATVGAHPKIRRGPVLEVNPFLDADVYTDLDGALETRTLTPGLGIRFMDGGSVSLRYAARHERLFAPTRIAGAEVPAGTFDWWEPSVRYTVPGSRRVSGSFSVSGGDFYDGRRTSLGARVRFRPNEHLTLDLNAQHNDLELGGTDFTADLFSARLRWARDTRTFLMGFVQLNEATDELISNVRFNLIHAPLSDVFLVYTERRSLADAVAEPVLERGVTLKVTKLLAF